MKVLLKLEIYFTESQPNADIFYPIFHKKGNPVTLPVTFVIEVVSKLIR